MSNDEDDIDEDEGEEDLSDLQKEFIAAQEKAYDEIALQMKIAGDAIEKAMDISEKYAIPFDAAYSPLNNIYTPDSYQYKFGDLDPDWVGGFIFLGEYPGAGWQHSDVC